MPFQQDSFDTIVSTFPAGFILSQDTWVEAMRVIRPADHKETGRLPRIIVVGLVIYRAGHKVKSENLVPNLQLIRQPVEQCQGLAEQAGFISEIKYHRVKGWLVPVIIAEPGYTW